MLGSIRLGPNAVSANEIVEVCQELAEVGFQQVIYMPNTHEIFHWKPLATTSSHA